MAPYEKKRKRVLKRLFVGVTLFLLAFTFFIFIQYFFGNYFPFAESNPLAWILLTTFLIVLSYQPVDHAYGLLFKYVLFPRRSKTLSILNHLSHDIVHAQDLRVLANLLVNTLGETLQLKTVSLLIRNPRGEGYSIASAYGLSVAGYRKVQLHHDSPLLQFIKAMGPQVLLRSKIITALSWQEANELTKDFEALHATCVIPLWSKTELLGSINLLSSTPEEQPDEGDLKFLKDFGDEVASSLAHALEIQELRMANDELRDAQSKLHQSAKLSAIEQLATGIAHEIHNPLTIISGKAQVLLLQKDQRHFDEKVEEVLKTIVKQTRRAADITKKLLMFSQTSATLHEKIRLETILEDTLSLIAYRVSLEEIEIQRLLANDLPDFYGNVQELREVFFNLIFNAVQAVDAGGRIQIGITYQRSDKVFVIQIADSGPGIAPENLDKVFNPFFSTRPEGTGLGLFVAQQIVNRYGGSIRVESQASEGTIFVVELPGNWSVEGKNSTETFKGSMIDSKSVEVKQK